MDPDSNLTDLTRPTSKLDRLIASRILENRDFSQFLSLLKNAPHYLRTRGPLRWLRGPLRGQNQMK